MLSKIMEWSKDRPFPCIKNNISFALTNAKQETNKDKDKGGWGKFRRIGGGGILIKCTLKKSHGSLWSELGTNL
jgi:hypothetical protein